MLTPKEIEDIKKLYHDRYDRNGYDITTVGWKNVEEQMLRFEILCDIGNMNQRSVCDIGCGFGDVIPYLENRFNNISYLGIDISDKLIQKASELYPNYEFQCSNILDESFNKKFDYFILSGALSYRIKNNIDFTKAMLTKMFSLAQKGIAVNFLSSYVNYQHIRNFHYSPEEIFSFSKTITPKVTLRHDYPLWEFTIYLYKED